MKKHITNIRRTLTLLCFAVFFMGIAISSKAANYYIAPASSGGSNSNTGTLASPWLTVAYASARLSAGDTLYARGGTYTGQGGYIWLSPSGTSTNPITFKNYGTETPVFDGGWTIGDFDISGRSWIVFDGITFQHYDDAYGNGAVNINTTSGATGNITIQNCKFYDNGTNAAQDHHIYINAGTTDITVRNCWFERAAASAIQLNHYPTATIRVKIYNNVIIGGTSTHYTGNQTFGIVMADGRDVEIYNNTIYGVQRGIDFSYGSAGSPGGTYVVKNNTITNCTEVGLRVSSSPDYRPYFSSDYNNIYNNSPNNIVWGTTGYTMAQFKSNTTNEVHGLSVNPLYVTSGSDFHLQSGSPMIGAGTSGGNIPTYDYDYVNRVNPYAIGAYDVACSAPSVPNAPSALSASAISYSQINLTWTDNSGIESAYLVERSPDGTTFTQIASLPANTTSYSNTGLTELTQYYYRVRATNCFGNSPYSSIVNATTPANCTAPSAPNPPTGPSATAISSSQINLAWTDNSGIEEHYEVERSTTSGSGFGNIATLGPNVTSYNNTTGLSPNQIYYYRIRATNCFGNSAYSSEVSATTCPSTVPSDPLYPTATPFSNTQINVGWYDNSAIETNYLIERSLNSTINFTQVGSVAANVTTFSDNTGLSANTKYYYRIRAWNCTGYTNYTTTVSATTTPTCSPGSAPGAPTSPSAAVGTGTFGAGTFQITVAWTNGTGTRTGNVVERSTNATNGFTQVANLGSSTTSYVDWGLSSGTLYYYRIRSVNCNGNSGYISTSATTNACSGTNPLGTPTTPLTPSATSNSSSQITVTWVDNSAIEAAYVIERSTSSGSGFVEVGRAAPSTTTFVDAGLSSSTTYYYRIWAWNCNGFSTQTGSPGGAGYISANATTASGLMRALASAPSTTSTTTIPTGTGKQVSLYPNPITSNFTLVISSEITIKNGVMKIYDESGKEMRAVSIHSNKTTIDRGRLHNGFYYYSIINNNKRMYSGKLVIE